MALDGTTILLLLAQVFWMEKPKPVRCTLLGPIANPAAGCKPGNNTLIKKLVDGRPAAQASL
jgi:hypothetical protein